MIASVRWSVDGTALDQKVSIAQSSMDRQFQISDHQFISALSLQPSEHSRSGQPDERALLTRGRPVAEVDSADAALLERRWRPGTDQPCGELADSRFMSDDCHAMRLAIG